MIRAITIRQPWAWAIAHSTKRIENRSWRTPHRGILAIHAAKTADRVPLPTGEDPVIVLGAVVAVVELVDIVRLEDVVGDQWAQGPWCWMLGNVRPLSEPVEVLGKRSVWTLPSEVERKVRRQIRD